MPTYFVSVTVARSPGITDEALIRLFREAAERSLCIPVEVSPQGLVIEAEPVSLKTFERSLRNMLNEHGARLDRIASTRI